jgi:hypothetical protein
MADMYYDLLKVILPKVLVEYFDFEKYTQEGETIHLYFTEKNSAPAEFAKAKLSSKGFFPEITIQDFPIRGHNAFLHVIRRRWLNADTGKVVHRNWDMVAKGTRMTEEFASFLKEISRY